jgi:hypothetical protein
MPAAVARRRTPPVRRFTSCVVATILGATAIACPNHNGEATHPPPEVYGEETDFSGRWRGEAGDVTGKLAIEALGENQYYANFRGEDRPVRYIVSLEQVLADPPGSGTPSNLALFTWQDGRGGRGHGWLLINRDQSALTGTFGRGDATTGLGVWTFIREGEG